MRYRTDLLRAIKSDSNYEECIPAIREWFACDHDQAHRIVSIARQGWDDGCAGAYPDGDYSSDADWCYGVGDDINKLELDLDIDDGSVFELYAECHSHGLDKAVTVYVDMTGDSGPMVHVQGPLAERWRDAEQCVLGSRIEYADGKDFAYALLPEDTEWEDIQRELGHWNLEKV